MRRLLTVFVPYIIIGPFNPEWVEHSAAASLAWAVAMMASSIAMGFVMAQWAARGAFYETHYYFRKSIGAIFALPVPDGYDIKSVEPWGPFHVVTYRKSV